MCRGLWSKRYRRSIDQKGTSFHLGQSAKICHVIHCVAYAFLHDVTCRSLYLPQRNVFLKHVSFYTADIVCIARKGGPGNLRCGICDISLDSSCQAPTW